MQAKRLVFGRQAEAQVSFAPHPPQSREHRDGTIGRGGRTTIQRGRYHHAAKCWGHQSSWGFLYQGTSSEAGMDNRVLNRNRDSDQLSIERLVLLRRKETITALEN